MTVAFLKASLALWKRRYAANARKHKKAHDNGNAKWAHRYYKRMQDAQKMVHRREVQIKNHKPDHPLEWMPGAIHMPRSSAGSMASGYKPRATWHTTEGNGPATSTLDANGSHPQLELLRDGRIIQYMPIHQAGKALKHTQSTETNRANNYQIEVDGHASEPNWPDAQVKGAQKIAHFLHDNCGVPLTADVSFKSPRRMSNGEWANYTGHCGHVHVPQNDHVDPGHIDIRRIIG